MMYMQAQRHPYWKTSRCYNTEETGTAAFPTNEASYLSYVGQAINCLPLPCAKVLCLYYQENRSCAEIASLLSNSEENIRLLLQLCQRILTETIIHNRKASAISDLI